MSQGNEANVATLNDVPRSHPPARPHRRLQRGGHPPHHRLAHDHVQCGAESGVRATLVNILYFLYISTVYISSINYCLH